MIRQDEEHASRRVTIVLDNHGPAADSDPAEGERQERSVSLAASLAADYIQRGHGVGLVTRTVSVGLGEGPAHLTRVLRALALLEFTREVGPYVAAAAWPGECVLVGRGNDPLPTMGEAP